MARKSAICKWIIFAISSFAKVEKKPFATNGFLFLDWTAKYIYYKKTKLFSSYPPLKPSLPMKRRKKKLFRSCKMEKKPSNNGKKRNSFTLEKLLIYFFLQIKFAFRKDPPNS